MRYFKAVDGRVCERFGSSSKIAASIKAGVGYVQDLSRIVVIPKAECMRYVKEYANALRNGDLLEVDESAYTAWLQAQRAPAKPLDAPTKQGASKSKQSKRSKKVGSSND